jgi:predicted SnoaL-like aldol condensation-catalyzing enzyme
MKFFKTFLPLLVCIAISAAVVAQTPVTPNAKPPEELAKSSNKQLEANKMLVLGLVREILEARHMELAGKYLAEDFIQHNPNAANGLPALKQFFAAQNTQPREIQPKVARKLVAMVAEGDAVLIVSPRELTDPKDKAQKYTTVGFDAYRIKNGKVIEHWDAALKNANAPAAAYTPVTPDSKPAEDLAKSSDKKLEANKMLVVNMWREAIEGRQRQAIEKYFSPNFIQHAATMAPGLEGIRNMVNRGQPQAVPAKTGLKPTLLIAEGDYVAAIFPRQYTDPKATSKKYTTAGLELYRIENGKIVEHWDEHEKAST